MYLLNNTILTNNLNLEFIPTFLYIKQHNITGLKYFGKTIRDNPEEYKGSGVYWSNHLAKHGNNVSTIWYQRFDTKESLVEFATNFSIQNNIVEAKNQDGKKIWANLIIENGLDGTVGGVTRSKEVIQKMKDSHPDFSGNNNPMWGRKHTAESNQKRRESMLAAKVKHSLETIKQQIATRKKNYVKENHPEWGKKFNAERRQKIRDAALGREKITCEFCSKLTSPSNYARWHGSNCRNK